MGNNIIESAQTAVRHWYLSLILGIVYLFLGIFILNTPLESYLTLSVFFSLAFLFSGISEIIYSIENRKILPVWGWNLVSGIIDFIFGVYLVSNPDVTLTVLPLYIGFLLMFRSFTAIALAIDLQRVQVPMWGMMLLLGILGVFFSLMMIWNPLFGGMTLVTWTSLAFITIGIFRIFFAFRLRVLNKLMDKF